MYTYVISGEGKPLAEQVKVNVCPSMTSTGPSIVTLLGGLIPAWNVNAITISVYIMCNKVSKLNNPRSQSG